MADLDQKRMLPFDNISLACCEFSKKVAELIILTKIEEKFPEDFEELVFSLSGNLELLGHRSDPSAAFREIEENIKTLKERGVSDEDIPIVLKGLSNYIKMGIEDAAMYRNFTHIIKLSELLDQYKFTREDIVNVFTQIDYDNKIFFVDCIEEMLEKNDIDSLQRFTQFLSKGGCNLGYDLGQHVYSYSRELTNAMKEDPNKAIKIISLLERIGLSEGAKSEIFARASHQADCDGDKDLMNTIMRLKANQTLS